MQQFNTEVSKFSSVTDTRIGILFSFVAGPYDDIPVFVEGANAVRMKKQAWFG